MYKDFEFTVDSAFVLRCKVRIKAEMLFKLSNLNSKLSLTLGYLNSALNNSAQDDKPGFNSRTDQHSGS